MDIIERIIQFFAREGAVIAGAPVTFIIAILIVGFVVWRVAKAVQLGQIEALKERIGVEVSRGSFAKEQLAAAEKELARLSDQIESMQPGETKDRAAESSAAAKTAIESAVESLTLPDDFDTVGYREFWKTFLGGNQKEPR